MQIYRFFLLSLLFSLVACGGGDGGENTVSENPSISLNGDNPMVLLVNDTYTEPGATASDVQDGDISASVQITGSVDTATVGEYDITYQVTNSSNLEDEVIRKVFVVNSTQLPKAKHFSEKFLINFNNSNHVTVNSATELNPTSALTIEAWVNADDVQGQHGIAGTWNDLGGNASRTYLFWIQAGSAELLISRNGAEFPRASVDISNQLGRWIHLAGTFDGTEIKIYLDGELAATTPLEGNINTNNQPFYIGRTESGSNQSDPFLGRITNVRLWNVARSANEIRDNRFRYLQSTPGLVSSWKMTEGSGVDIFDTISNLDGILSTEDWIIDQVPGPVETAINTDLRVRIIGQDFSGLGVKTIITQLPANGKLYQRELDAKGTEITAANTEVTDAKGIVIYEPNNNYTGGDSFNYKVVNGFQETPVEQVIITVE